MLSAKLPSSFLQQPSNAPLARFEDKKDQYGNLVMQLTDFGLSSTIRYHRVEEGIRFSEIDVVKAVTGKNQNYANEIIRNLSPEVKVEVNEKSFNLQFKGPGQKETTLITYQGVLKLIMALPGINAREIRTKFSDVIQRYFAGDVTLVEELAFNFESQSDHSRLARDDISSSQSKKGALGKRKAVDKALEGEKMVRVTRLAVQRMQSRVASKIHSSQASLEKTLQESKGSLEVAIKESENKLTQHLAPHLEGMAMMAQMMQGMQTKLQEMADFKQVEEKLRADFAKQLEETKQLMLASFEKEKMLLEAKHIKEMLEIRGAPINISDVVKDLRPEVNYSESDLKTLGGKVRDEYKKTFGRLPPFGIKNYPNGYSYETYQYYKKDYPLILGVAKKYFGMFGVGRGSKTSK